MKYLFHLCLLSIGVSFSSCYLTKEKPYDVTAFNYGNDFNYELQIKYHSKGRGNVHTPSLAKFEYDSFDWIYVNHLQGKVIADSLVFTHYQRKTEYPWNQSQLKGYIEFMDDSTISINLMMPYYKDDGTVGHLKPYEFNGKYKLNVKKEFAKLIEEN